MAHSGYSDSLEKELSTQTGLDTGEVMRIKTAAGKKYLGRIHDGMTTFVEAVRSASSAGSTLIGNMESLVTSSATTDGGNGLDLLPGNIKFLIKEGKFKGAVKSSNINKGYYWVPGNGSLYRFNNRNEFDTFQKGLAAQLTQDVVSDLDKSINSKMKSLVKGTASQKDSLNTKSRTAATTYSTHLASILAGVSA